MIRAVGLIRGRGAVEASLMRRPWLIALIRWSWCVHSGGSGSSLLSIMNVYGAQRNNTTAKNHQSPSCRHKLLFSPRIRCQFIFYISFGTTGTRKLPLFFTLAIMQFDWVQWQMSPGRFWRAEGARSICGHKQGYSGVNSRLWREWIVRLSSPRTWPIVIQSIAFRPPLKGKYCVDLEAGSGRDEPASYPWPAPEMERIRIC